MKVISISKFKATCLSLIERVRKTGEPMLITKRGVPVAQIAPPPPPIPSDGTKFGCMAGTVREIGDIVEPLGDEGWEALQE